MIHRWTRVARLAALAFLCTRPLLAQDAAKPLVVTGNIALTRSRIETPIRIEKDGVVVDGGGAHLVGPGSPGNPDTHTGVGIYAKGIKNVTLKNIKVSGFRRGLHLEDVATWKIENCDFSGNYHNPEYGWGDYDRVGGMIFDRSRDVLISNCKSRDNWNGIDLFQSCGFRIERCDASHCSNVCLKLEQASDNTVDECNLSYGIRISPGEVHARDSTSVLIESGSDNNRFTKNDITHGGDGVFIRVLNGWMSTGNVFVENDCSYANNNGFESWSQGNTYIRNKANYCSYGFWLGGSDHTVLEGNEAAFNGTDKGHRNAPESDFSHGGIVIVGGTGTHTILDGNYCHDNAGGGIVVRGDLGTRGRKWKMYHLVIQNNRLENNRWGLFARFADWVDLGNNLFKANEKDEFFEDVTGVSRRGADPENALRPQARIVPGEATVFIDEGTALELDGGQSSEAKGRSLHYSWRISRGDWTGDPVLFETPRIRHVFEKEGFYRIGLTVDNGYTASLAWVDCYVRRRAPELGTEGSAGSWSASSRERGPMRVTHDSTTVFSGKESLHVSAADFPGGTFELQYKPESGPLDLSKQKSLVFWLKYQNANIGGFGGPQPIVRLQSGGGGLVYSPVSASVPANLLGELPWPEGRKGWIRIAVDLEGSASWTKSEVFDGGVPNYYDSGLEFETVDTPVENQQSAAIVAAGKILFLAVAEGERLYRSDDGGRAWREVKSPASLGGSPGDWMGGMLAFDPRHYQQGALFTRHREPKSAGKEGRFRLVVYDIAKDEWQWTVTPVSMSHGLAVSGKYLFGIAHARMGNYGGGICRVSLDPYKKSEDRTMFDFGGTAGVPDPDWYSRAAQFCSVQGKIYGIKNDWTTPAPADPARSGDILFWFDPAAFRPSLHSGSDPEESKGWREFRTPATAVARLPFEAGHGASVVEVPPGWSPDIGKKGGLFLLAGCSPSNHEGWGPPSRSFALFDIESSKFTVGQLPGATGGGSAAAFSNGKVMIKRGGTNFAKTNREAWIVSPMTRESFQAARSVQERRRIGLEKVESIVIQFESAGGKSVDLWLDALSVAP
jgi:parallel beta-helix repeat protein